jgi:hypothetical protein
MKRSPLSRRRPKDITPHEVYDIAVMLNEHGLLTQGKVEFELDAHGLIGTFAIFHHPLRRAFDAAKAGKPFPAELEQSS